MGEPATHAHLFSTTRMVKLIVMCTSDMQNSLGLFFSFGSQFYACECSSMDQDKLSRDRDWNSSVPARLVRSCSPCADVVVPLICHNFIIACTQSNNVPFDLVIRGETAPISYLIPSCGTYNNKITARTHINSAIAVIFFYMKMIL